jgi:hypothetical protein
METRRPRVPRRESFGEGCCSPGSGKAYAPGSLVTRSGGLWLALKATTATPGTDALSWKLIVRSGGA